MASSSSRRFFILASRSSAPSFFFVSPFARPTTLAAGSLPQTIPPPPTIFAFDFFLLRKMLRFSVVRLFPASLPPLVPTEPIDLMSFDCRLFLLPAVLVLALLTALEPAFECNPFLLPIPYADSDVFWRLIILPEPPTELPPPREEPFALPGFMPSMLAFNSKVGSFRCAGVRRENNDTARCRAGAPPSTSTSSPPQEAAIPGHSEVMMSPTAKTAMLVGGIASPSSVSLSTLEEGTERSVELSCCSEFSSGGGGFHPSSSLLPATIVTHSLPQPIIHFDAMACFTASNTCKSIKSSCEADGIMRSSSAALRWHRLAACEAVMGVV
mmetsp:Transcript_27524/g.52174  ORF Transcript_27524/g.52174 Transcript_27524/m.52174 type:complete len:326 (-) Transcript_27524:858-1835(-)